MNKIKIAISGDHAGFSYIKELKEMLSQKGYEVKDFGPVDESPVDYPDHIHPLADAVENKEFNYGISICGSGNGVAMTANKHKGIRAALCWNKELAVLARQHNDANVLCLPARFVSIEEAKEMVEVFLDNEFEGGRHGRRVGKIVDS